MGAVYEVEDSELNDEIVALKTILPSTDRDGVALKRFRREVQFARRVTNVHACRTYDVGFHVLNGTNVVFVTMEYIEGETLHARVRAAPKSTPDEALLIARQIASGVAAAHEVGVIHRDIKSANIMLRSHEGRLRAVVTDFGLARLEVDDGLESLTNSGMFIGTPAYMAPEQVEGGTITPAADVYAIGVVMFEMVTGRLPFVASTPMAMAIRRLNEPAPSPRKFASWLDPTWEAVIRRCLARKPEDRFENAQTLARALDDVRAEEELQPTLPKPTPSPPQTRWRTLLLVGVVLAGALLTTIIYRDWITSKSVPLSARHSQSDRTEPEHTTATPKVPLPTQSSERDRPKERNVQLTRTEPELTTTTIGPSPSRQSSEPNQPQERNVSDKPAAIVTKAPSTTTTLGVGGLRLTSIVGQIKDARNVNSPWTPLNTSWFMQVLKKTRKRPTLLVFGATWCAPFVSDFPMLDGMRDQYQSRVLFVGLVDEQDTPSTRERIARLVEPHDFKLHYFLKDASIHRTVFKKEEVLLPAFALFDANDELVATFVGSLGVPKNAEALRASLDKVSGERRSSGN